MATARDVARRAGVSTSTVSHVLNGTRGVSKELRARVLAACDELNFEPNIVARSLKTNRSHTIALIVPDVNPVFTEILLGLEEAAVREGYAVVFCHSRGDVAQESAYLRLLRGRRVDGIVLAPVGVLHEELDRLVRSGFPLVLIDRTMSAYSVDSVAVDNEPAACAAVRHLIDQGHRRIGLISGDPQMSSSEPRIQGYRRALAEAGIEIDPRLQACGWSRTKDGQEAAMELLRQPDPPSALFVANNLMAIGALMAIQELRLVIPDDVAFVSFDDFEWARLFRPRLTAVAQPLTEIGRTAAQLVLERIADENGKPARRVALGAALHVRESSGPPRHAFAPPNDAGPDAGPGVSEPWPAVDPRSVAEAHKVSTPRRAD